MDFKLKPMLGMISGLLKKENVSRVLGGAGGGSKKRTGWLEMEDISTAIAAIVLSLALS